MSNGRLSLCSDGLNCTLTFGSVESCYSLTLYYSFSMNFPFCGLCIASYVPVIKFFNGIYNSSIECSQAFPKSEI